MKRLKFIILGLMISGGFVQAEYPVGLQGQDVRDIRASFFDADDNIFRTFNYIWLFDSTGKQFPVTTEEFAELRQSLDGEGQLPDGYRFRRIDGVEVDLSGYGLDSSLATGSLREFADAHGTAVNYLKKGVSQAMRMSIIEKDTLGVARPSWQGPSYGAFQESLSDLETVIWTFIITARMNLRESFHGVFADFVETGDLQNNIPLTNIWPVGSPEFPRYFREAFGEDAPAAGVDSSGTKLLVISKILDIIGSYPGSHTAGFSDDDYGNFEKAWQGLDKGVQDGRWPNITITVFFTGLTESEAPHALILRNGQPPERVGPEKFKDLSPSWKRVEQELFDLRPDLKDRVQEGSRSRPRSAIGSCKVVLD